MTRKLIVNNGLRRIDPAAAIASLGVFPALVKPLRPLPERRGWYQYRGVMSPELQPYGKAAEIWLNHSLFIVLSCIEVIKDGQELNHPEYHLSISKEIMVGGVAIKVRCDQSDALWVLQSFGCEGAEEDKADPDGLVRNFWRPVNDRTDKASTNGAPLPNPGA